MCEHYKYMIQLKPEFDVRFKTTGKHSQMIYLCEVEDVKRGLTKLSYDNVHYNLLVKECGKCHICRFKKASIKACQAQCEAKTYKNNCSFVTLTFGREAMEKYIHSDKRFSGWSNKKKNDYVNFLEWSLDKRELTLFMKRLRFHFEQQQIKQFIRKNCLWQYLYKKNGQERKRLFLPKCYDFKPTRIRFLSASEYGEAKLRPHHHLIIYGVKFSKDYSKTRWSWKKQQNVTVYFNHLLDKLWQFGEATTDDVNYHTCNYVARYCTKKVVNKDKYMTKVDLAGEVYNGKLPEYCRQSNRHGLGYDYFMQNKKKIIADNQLFFQNIKGEIKSTPLPAYFKKLMRKYCLGDYLYLKRHSLEQQLEFSKKTVDDLYTRMLKDRNKTKMWCSNFIGDYEGSGLTKIELAQLVWQAKKNVFNDIKDIKQLYLKSAYDTDFVNYENIRVRCYRNYENYKKYLLKQAEIEYIHKKNILLHSPNVLDPNKCKSSYSDLVLDLQRKRFSVSLLDNPFTKQNLNEQYVCPRSFDSWLQFNSKEHAYAKNYL